MCYTKRHGVQVKGHTLEAGITEGGYQDCRWKGKAKMLRERRIETEPGISKIYPRAAVGDNNMITKMVKGKEGGCWFG